MVINLLATVTWIISTLLESSDSVRVSLPVNNATAAIFNATSFAGPKLQRKLVSALHPAVMISYTASIVCITIDTLARFILCPFKRAFFKSVFNIIDITVLSVTFLALIVSSLLDMSVLISEQFTVGILVVDAFTRISLVFRLLKFGRHISGLQVLFFTVKSSLPVIFVLLTLMGMATILFASLIYVTEIKTEDFFPNALTGLWWAFITMTTVGYGDMYPVTPSGYVVGILCVTCGLLFTALPIAVLGSNFATYWSHAAIHSTRQKEAVKFNYQRHTKVFSSGGRPIFGSLIGRSLGGPRGMP